MSAIVQALDNYTPVQYGENGHVEYGWSNNIKEQILQFSFQLTRTTNSVELSTLENKLVELLTALKNKLTNSVLVEKEITLSYLNILYKLLGQTRDIIDGKGECTLSYMMLYTWYNFFPELAMFALKCFVNLGANIHPYGSWKDLKYFCKYCKEKGDGTTSQLIQYAIQLINDQIREDYNLYTKSKIFKTETLSSSLSSLSLVSKWVPREKSSFGWMYEELSSNYFSNYLNTAITNEQKRKALLKCKTEYRKILSMLNKYIDTLQIKQCDKRWSNIDFNKVTSVSISKQKKAFLNIKKNGEVRNPEDKDRILCAEHFKNHIQKSIEEKKEVKGMRVSMSQFTLQALHAINPTEISLLNSQWRDNSTQTSNLSNMIAMVDVSGSMDGEPMYTAIALGIRIAEKSRLGKRVMTFSNSPKWVNLDPYPDFVSQVNVIKNADWGGNTNFYAALNMILEAIIQNKMNPQDVEDMVLVILSDMQIDNGDKCDKKTLYDIIGKKYEEAGIRVCGTPYKPPHILFWNLRSTSGFPTLSSQENTSMMSGFSPSLLNLFCDEGLSSLKDCNPFSNLLKMISNERYQILEDEFNRQLNSV